MSPRNLANLWIKAQNQAQASGNGSRKIWDDYVYAGEGTDCFLCGMNPGPSERYIAPDGTRTSVRPISNLGDENNRDDNRDGVLMVQRWTTTGVPTRPTRDGVWQAPTVRQ